MFGIREEVVKESTRVCCRHFSDGGYSKEPSITLGKRFASPLQSNHQRKAAAVCFVYGSARTAPGISSRLREISVLLVLIAT